MNGGRDPLAVAIRVARAFDALGIRHTIGGSIAASFAGEPRSTIDIVDRPMQRRLVGVELA